MLFGVCWLKLQRGLLIVISFILLIITLPFVFGDVVINEFLANSVNTDYEWIELFNNGTFPVNLSNFNISEEAAAQNFTISDVTIGSNGFIVLVRNETIFNQTYNTIGLTVIEYGSSVPSLNLNDGSDSIFLYNDSGEIIDSILNYANPGENVSIGRYPDGSSNIVSLLSQTPSFQNDNAPPNFPTTSINSSNPKINEVVQISANCSDDVKLSMCIFSWNGTSNGQWVNVSSNSSVEVSSFNYTVNLTVGLGNSNIIGYQFYANDSYNKFNNSALQTFTVADTSGSASISINKTSPRINEIVNVSSNLIDADGLSFCTIKNNQTGSFAGNTFAISGTSGFCSSAIPITTAHAVINFTVEINDTARNIYQNSSIISVANTPPSGLSIIFPTNNLYTSSQPLNVNVAFPADADSDAITINYYINGKLNGSTNANTTFNASDGVYRLNVSLFDGFNSSSNATTVAFTIDTTLPAISELKSNDLDNITRNDITLNFTVNVSDTNFVNVSLNGTLMNFIGSNLYSLLSNANSLGCVNDGICLLNATALDLAGNINSIKYLLTVDNTAPNVAAINAPLNNKNITGITTFNATVTDAPSGVQKVYFNVTNSGNFIIINLMNSGNYYFNNTFDTAALADGQHTATVYAFDNVGNLNNTVSVAFTSDNTGPNMMLELNKTPEPSYNDNDVKLNATINDTLSNVDKVILSGNWTGSWVNYTTSTGLMQINQVYSFLIGKGNFSNQQMVGYVWYANDTLGNDASSSSQIFQVTNRAPVFNLSNPVQNVTILEGEIGTTSLANTFYDLDLDDLNYSAISASSLIISINNGTAIATITPATGFFGTVGVVFIASDFVGAANQSNNVTVIVSPLPNHNPTFSTIPKINFSEDSSYTTLDLSNFCSDSDPGQICTNFQLNFISNNNVNVVVNNITGDVFINATPDFHGVAAVRFLVEDNYTGIEGPGSALSNSVVINVTSVNDAPKINFSAGNINQTADEDFTQFIFDLTPFETDVDAEDTGTGLNWSIGNINSSLINVSLDTATNVITFTAIPNAHGANLLQINLTDSHNATAVGSMLVTINSINDLVLINSTIGPFTVFDNAPTIIDLTGKANDDNDFDANSLVWDVINENTSLWDYAGTGGGQSILFNPKVINDLNNRADTVIIKVTDPDGAVDSVSVNVAIVPFNDAPSQVSDAGRTPANSSPQTSAVDQFVLDWQDSADQENQPVIYYVFFGNNTDPLFNGTSAVSQYSLSNLTNNTVYYWHVIASDNVKNATKSATWQFITNFDNAPKVTAFQPVGNVTMLEDSIQTFNATVEDIDGGFILFNWTVNGIERLSGTTLTFNESASFAYQPSFNDSGIRTVKLDIKDLNNNIGTPQIWTVNVINNNRAPVLDPISNYIVNEDSALEFNATGSDPDVEFGDTLNFSSNVTSMLFNKFNATLSAVSWTPTNDNVGNNTVNITVSDGLLKDSKIFIIEVINTNDAPTITSFFPAENKTIAANVGSQKFNITSADIDAGDSLTIDWFRNGTLIATNSANATVSGLIKGIYNITVIVNDSSGAAARNEWALDATDEIEGDGLVSNILNLSETERQNATDIAINQSAFGNIDFGSNTLNFSGIINLEDAFNISNGLISVDADSFPGLNKSASLVMKALNFTKAPLIFMASGFENTANGALCPETVCTNITYDVSNGILRFDAAHFTTFFTQQNMTNGAPMITSVPVTAATEGTAYRYDAEAADPDGNALTFSLLAAPSGMSISSSSGIISWTPSISQIGINNATVSVSDGNLTDSQSFQINVSEGAKLIISKLDVKIDEKSDKSIQNNTKIKKEAKPGSDVEFKIEIKNRFTKEEDLEMQDIGVQVIIEDIDDGDDLEEEADEFDLDPEKDETVKISFKIPLEVEEDTFEVIIDIEGQDENGTVHRIKWLLELKVEKEKHDISIRKLNLNPTIVSCSRTAALNAEIINLGRDDEDEVALEILSPKLGVNFRQGGIELEEGIDDNTYAKTLTMSIPDGMEAGTYPITVNAYFENDDLDDSKTAELSVQDCERIREEKEAVKEEPVKPKAVEVIRPPVVEEKKPQVTQIAFRESDSYLILLSISFILLSGLAVFALGAAVMMFIRK